MTMYLVKGSVPLAGELSLQELRAISEQSNIVLHQLRPDIQWLRSYITDDKIYATFAAANEAVVWEYARLAGLPVDQVMEVKNIIDPTTAVP